MSWDEGVVACYMHAWVWPIYRRLKDRGEDVSFGYVPMDGAINLIHGQVGRYQLKLADLNRYFIIGIRADFRPFPYGELEIVQNRNTAGGRRFYMPHFPQPGLIPREAGRTEVVNVCAAGEPQNFPCMDELNRKLEEIGCRFVFKAAGDWQNMADIDILLGIRSFSEDEYHSKPPTKLFNAWLAGIPFIGGYDSAYGQVGIAGENFLQVSSVEGLINAVHELKESPTLYNDLVDAGKQAVLPYTPEKIAGLWMDFLGKEGVQAFRRWEKSGRLSALKLWFKGCRFEIMEKQLRGAKKSDVWN